MKGFQAHPYLLMVSDASDKAKAMTFGWVLNTPSRQYLTQAASHYQGRERPLRAVAT